MKIIREKFISASPKLIEEWNNFKNNLVSVAEASGIKNYTVPDVYLGYLPRGKQEAHNVLFHWYPIKDSITKGHEIHMYCVVYTDKIGFYIYETG